MLIPPLRCVLRSLRSSSSARWFPRCGAVVVIAELFAAVAAGDTVAVLLFGPLFRHAAVAVPQMFAAAAAGDLFDLGGLPVLLPAACGRRREEEEVAIDVCVCG